MSKFNEHSTERLAHLAAFALLHPEHVTYKQIKALAGSVLTQVKNRAKAKVR